MNERQTDYQEEVLDDFQREYKESEQILDHTKDPQLVEFHQGRIEYLRPLLESAGVISKGGIDGDTRQNMET